VARRGGAVAGRTVARGSVWGGAEVWGEAGVWGEAEVWGEAGVWPGEWGGLGEGVAGGGDRCGTRGAGRERHARPPAAACLRCA